MSLSISFDYKEDDKVCKYLHVISASSILAPNVKIKSLILEPNVKIYTKLIPLKQ